ncbi:MAG: hypothetical protein V4659_03895 [Pseudomonadota bacterium]
MTAFSAACDALFDDPNLAADVIWWPAAGGPSLAVRVILARPDLQSGYGDAQIVSDSVRLDVRASEVASPGAGDRVALGTEILVVQGEPRRDRLRLVWQCEAAPEC